MKIKCLIVDDEPLAIRLIENHISKMDTLEVVATANNAMKAFEILTTEQIDLLFLDIKMPNITGIDFLKNLKNPPKTIFTTAYRDYAIESYELEVIDYLLKPITFERFFKSIEKFLRLVSTDEKTFTENVDKNEDYILLKSLGKNYKIALTDIIYIESIKDYIKVHKTDKSSIVSKFKISELEDQLPTDKFVRIHRSYIVNTTKISAFSSTDIEVAGVELPIGVSYKLQAEALFDKIRKV